MQAKCRAVCAEFPEIFSDVLADEPADLDPFEFDANLPEWQVRENQGPLRKNPPKKEVALVEIITQMIKSKIIEKSKAAYYTVTRSPGRGSADCRVCMDYRVMDLTSGYHCSPIASRRGYNVSRY